MENEANAPYQIALSMYNKQVLIYSSDNVLNAINLRWRGQIQENAKHIAYGGYLPEMNHNEINSFVNPKNLVKEQTFVFLLDKLYHPRVIKRFEVIEEILKEQEHNILVIQSHAKGLITRMFDLAYLGDWVSYYLAMMNEEDPTPIPLIIKLKDELSK
jgi:glucose/mannose-6-phosphate isomerase